MFNRLARREFLGLGAALPMLAGADPATLKIKRLEPYVLKIGSRRDIVCARIETAEGIHGWGEGTTPPNVQPVVAQIRSFEKLLAGQSARMQLSLHSSSDALMVSSQALIPSSQGYSVYTVRNKQVQLTAVEIGQRGPYSVEVLHGLNKGDTVVTSNLLRLMPGAAVQFASLR